MITRRGCFIAKGTTVEETINKISDFPRRYHKFRPTKNDDHWVCSLICRSDNMLVLHLIDANSDRPRGEHDSRVDLHVTLTPNSQGVNIRYYVIWRKSMALSIICCLLILFLAFLFCLWCAVEIDQKYLVFAMVWGLFEIGAGLGFVWELKHAKKIIYVFELLLSRNFSCYNLK